MVIIYKFLIKHISLKNSYYSYIYWNSSLWFIAEVIECAINNGGCQFICRDTPGSYVCFCPQGMPVNEDGHTCPEGNYLFECFIDCLIEGVIEEWIIVLQRCDMKWYPFWKCDIKFRCKCNMLRQAFPIVFLNQWCVL